jgi:hypothetical protein
MAKAQKRSNREVRKPKAAKGKSKAPTELEKRDVVPGLENMKR